MSAIAADPMPALVTIPNIELVTVGPWSASTGPVEFELADLQAMIAALDDEAIHEPRLRIGHTPAGVSLEESAGGFKEQPAFGRFTNLRLVGDTIVADAVGVPAWLAEILPSAFPSRSVEVYWNYTTAAGRTHAAVMTSVALLGVSLPAVETLEDLQLAFGAEIPEGVQFTYGGRVAASKGAAMPEPTRASVTYSDVRRSFYEEVATQETGRYWWWICDFIISPSTVIADDDEGGLWSITYKAEKDDTITWGDPVEVRVQYVDAKGKVAATRASAAPDGDRQTFRTAAESGRPQDRVRAAQPPERSTQMDGAELRALLGLPEDATDDQVKASFEASKAKTTALEKEVADLKASAGPETPALGAPAPAAAPEGAVALDTATLEQLKADAQAGREALAAQVKARQVGKVDAAIEAGKLIPARRDHYLALMSSDEDGTTAFIDKLEAGLVPVKERGTSGQEPNGGGDGARLPLDAVMASFGTKPRELAAAGKEQ